MISADAVRTALWAIAMTFAVGSVLVIAAGWFLRDLGLFNMSEEANLPTWYSSTQLLMVAAVAAAIGWMERLRGDSRHWWCWLLWAAAFAALSLDETAGLHERLGHRFTQLTGLGSGSVSEASHWVLAAGPVLIVALWLLVRFVWKRLRDHPWCLAGLVAGSALWVFVLAAELYEEPFVAAQKDMRLARVLEESAEVLGATLWLACLTFYLGRLLAPQASQRAERKLADLRARRLGETALAAAPGQPAFFSVHAGPKALEATACALPEQGGTRTPVPAQ